MNKCKMYCVFFKPNSSCSVAHLGCCNILLRWCTCPQAHLTVSSSIPATNAITGNWETRSPPTIWQWVKTPAASRAENSFKLKHKSCSSHETNQHLRPSAKHFISYSSLNWKVTERGNFPAGIREQERWRCTFGKHKTGCSPSQSWC